jgi:hypothetical protein
MDINRRLQLVQAALAGVEGLQAGLNERLAANDTELGELDALRADAQAEHEHLETVLIELRAAVGTGITMLSDDDVAKLDALAGNLDRATLRNFALNAGLDAVGNTIQSIDKVVTTLKKPLTKAAQGE